MDARSVVTRAVKNAENKPLPETPWFSVWGFESNPFALKPKDFESSDWLVDRSVELEQLTELLVFFARGLKGLFVLWGPEGVGKTSVVKVAIETVFRNRANVSQAFRERLDGQILDCQRILCIDESDAEEEEADHELEKPFLAKSLEEYRDKNQSFFVLDDCSKIYHEVDTIETDTRIVQARVFVMNCACYRKLLKENRLFRENVSRLIEVGPLDFNEMKAILKGCLHSRFSDLINEAAAKKVIENSLGIPSLMLSICNRLGEYVSQDGRKLVTLGDVNRILENEFPFISSSLTRTELAVLELFLVTGSLLSVGDVAQRLTLARTSASAHLSGLREKGFVERQVIRRKAYFELVNAAQYVIDRRIYDFIERDMPK